MLAEFDRISERGGVLGAMETGYQRGRIQDESMLYEHRKHDGSLPIIGVNTFIAPDAGESPREVVLARASEAEKEGQLARVTSFRESHRVEAEDALARLKAAAVSGENVFAVLMDAARVCSLQQVTEAFFEVGGQYPAQRLTHGGSDLRDPPDVPTYPRGCRYSSCRGGSGPADFAPCPRGRPRSRRSTRRRWRSDWTVRSPSDWWSGFDGGFPTQIESTASWSQSGARGW